MRRLTRFLAPTVRFLLQTEVHVYAFAIAASLLLSFFPFLVLILSVCQNVLRWRQAVDVVYLGLRDFLPADQQLFEFLRHNLRVAVASRGQVEAVSVVLLLFASNGIFEPLEVALNRVWGIPANRSFWRNQWVSFGLAMVCGILALVSTLLTAMNKELLDTVAGPLPRLARWASLAALKSAALPVSIVVLFLIYWLLPNGSIPKRAALAAAIIIGIAVEAAKYIYFLIWPLLDFRRAYGPFFISVTLVIWGMVASLIVLAGAEISARWRAVRPEPAPPPAREAPRQTK